MCFDRMNTCRQKQMQPPGAAASVSDISPASDEELLYVIFVESVSALGAEFRGILGILRLPAALLAAVKRRVGGLFRSALGAELALVHRSAGAGPALGVCRLRRAALGAEFTRCSCSALALPAVRGLRLRFFCAALGTEFAVHCRAAGTFPAACRCCGS